MVYLTCQFCLPLSGAMVRGCFHVSVFDSPCMLLSSSIPAFWPFLAIYVAWINWVDKSPEHGTRLSPWFRSLKIWKYFAEYYPASYVSIIMSNVTVLDRCVERAQIDEGELIASRVVTRFGLTTV